MKLHHNDIRANGGANTLLRASTPLAPGNAQASVPLSAFASAYSNGIFYADIVSPVNVTDDIKGTFYKFSHKDTTTELSSHVGELGTLNQIEMDLTTGTYACLGYGLRAPVSLQLQNVADDAVEPKRRMSENAMHRLLLSREIRVATQITTSGNWLAAATTAASNVWSDQTAGTPATDIRTALEAIPASNGLSRKVAICALEVFNDLKSHPEIRDMHGTVTGQITEEILAGYIGVDQLLVSDAQKATSNTGQTTLVVARIWLATVFAIVLVPLDGQDPLNTECFSKTFRRNLAGSSGGILVREWHAPDQGTEGVEHVGVTHEDDEVIVRDDAGHLITSVG